jgi:hypothetical protein
VAEKEREGEQGGAEGDDGCNFGRVASSLPSYSLLLSSQQDAGLWKTKCYQQRWTFSDLWCAPLLVGPMNEQTVNE